MKTYRIWNSDLEVSRIGYGCMHLSRAWDDAPLTAEERSRTHVMIDAALAQGINLFDHADIYARGKGERLFGEALRQRPSLRGQMVLQSKCGIRLAGNPEPGAPQRYDFSHAHIVASVEASLQRLGTDYLDILLLHRPDPLGQPEEVAQAFDALHRAGKVRHFGVSNHTGAQIALLQRHVHQPLIINQVELSLLHHLLIDEGIMANQVGTPYSAAGTLDYCRQHDILVQAWSPLASGRLAAPPESMEETLRATAGLVLQLAKTQGVEMEAILLAWLLRHPAGIQPIVGTTHPERLIASCAADAIELSREHWYALFAAARGHRMP
jgi:predicted oxidoreductase